MAYVILNGMMILGVNLVATGGFYKLDKEEGKKEVNKELLSLENLLIDNNFLVYPNMQEFKKIKTRYKIKLYKNIIFM